MVSPIRISFTRRAIIAIASTVLFLIHQNNQKITPGYSADPPHSWGSVYTDNISSHEPKIKCLISTKRHDSLSHPHIGARDSNGLPFVHDAKALLMNRAEFNVTLESHLVSEICNSVDADSRGSGEGELLRMISEHIKSSAHAPSRRGGEIFCAIYTYPGHANNTQAIARTWAKKCDGFMAATTSIGIVESTGHIHIPHIGTEGSYNSIWQKVRSMLAYLHDNFFDDYEWFHINGDDTYLIVDNLRNYLSNDERILSELDKCKPLYIGGWMQPYWLLSGRKKEWLDDIGGIPWKDFYYAGGGSGYTLNRAALAVLVNEIFPAYLSDVDLSPEDLFIGMSFWKHSIKPFDSRDHTGRERYHHFSPKELLDPPSLLQKQRAWQASVHKYNSSKIGLDSVSPSSVAFHQLKSPEDMYRVHLQLYDHERKEFCRQDD